MKYKFYLYNHKKCYKTKNNMYNELMRHATTSI